VVNVAKISLQNYLNNVDQMLDDNQFNDVVQHCLHILKLYPRHLDTYRALGKAFLGLRKNIEAIDLFQRVLSAEPNDLYAHVALSDMYRTEMQADLSNWHLQRALELDPYNEAIQEEYRDVFFTEEDDDFSAKRIPLNDPALGKIYLRGELFDQATAVLQKSLAESPERVDQEVVLAEAMWREGNYNDAEAVCHQILEKLPYCLTANAILSDIWLKENRISAAQPLLRIVQSLVQRDQETVDLDTPEGRALTAAGAPVLPSRIMLEVWDETAVSAVTDQPTADWVSEIPFGETVDEEASFADADMTSDPGDMYGWLKGVTAELRGEPPLEPSPAKEESEKGETDWFADKALEDTAAQSDDHSVTAWLEGQRAGLLESESDEDVPSPLPDWMSSNQDVTPAEADSTAAPVEQRDVPDWLNEESDFEPMQFDPESASQWLDDSVESEVEESPLPDVDDSVDEAADWLAELSDEIDELTSAPLDPEAAGVEPLEREETAVSDKTTSDTTDWLKNLASEEDAVGNDDWLAGLTGTIAESEESSPVESEPVSESDDIFAADDWLGALDAAPAETIAETGDLADLDDDWLGALDAVPEETIAETGDLADAGDDWLNDLAGGEEIIESSPQIEEPPLVEQEGIQFDSQELLAALAGDDGKESDDNAFNSIIEEDPLDDDWLAALAGEEFDRTADYQEQQASQEDDIDDDWLAELEKGTSILSEESTESITEPVDDESEDIFSESSLTDWLSGDDLEQLPDVESEAAAEESSELEGSLTDWLSGDDLEQLPDVESEVAAEEPPELEASLTDWLSGDDLEQLPIDGDDQVDKPVSEDASLTDWLSGEEAENRENEILAGMESSESSSPDLPDTREELQPTEDAGDIAEMSVTDWLSGELFDEIDDLEASEMSSLGEENDREQTDLPKPESEETPSDEMMDWLDDLASDDEPEAEQEAEELEITKSTSDMLEPDQAELPDWLSRAADMDDEETAVSSEAPIPDWLEVDSELPEEQALSEFNIDSTFEGTAEPPGPPTSLLEELEPTRQEPEEKPSTEDDVSWLSELAESDDGGDTTALDWLGEEQGDDALLDWMDDLDSVVKETGALEPVESDVVEEAETAVSDEDDEDDEYDLPDDIPSDLDDAMSWLED
jgi:tetratricopeptide (TPR) repeat protein